MRRSVRRHDPRSLSPERNRVGKAAKLPKNLAEAKTGIDALRRFAQRASKTKHRVDRSAFPPMAAAACEPLGGRLRRHALRRAFSASSTGRGVTRYNVRPTMV